MESRGQSFFSLLVKSYVMREMSEISRSSTSLLAESNGFTDKNVTLMGFLPSKRIYDERINASQLWKFGIVDAFHIGYIGKVAEAVAEDGQAGMHHLNGHDRNVTY